MFLTSLLLLAVLPYIHSISLTSSPAQLKAPGDSVKLSCQVSGYALTSQGTGWILQQPGKTLEWIGIIWGGGSINSGASFKSRFTISRDSSNVLYLDITSLQAEDTAVYYCARGHGDTNQQQTCTITHQPINGWSYTHPPGVGDLNLYMK
uniref:Ig-like domain-containing protein n=1 Tax=Salmo trutta TaxID=8032 RepID=A0A673XP36_SALTR